MKRQSAICFGEKSKKQPQDVQSLRSAYSTEHVHVFSKCSLKNCLKKVSLFTLLFNILLGFIVGQSEAHLHYVYLNCTILSAGHWCVSHQKGELWNESSPY